MRFLPVGPSSAQNRWQALVELPFHWPPYADRCRPHRDGFENVRAATDTTVRDNRNLASDAFVHFGQAFYRRAQTFLISSSMIRYDEAVHAVTYSAVSAVTAEVASSSLVVPAKFRFSQMVQHTWWHAWNSDTRIEDGKRSFLTPSRTRQRRNVRR